MLKKNLKYQQNKRKGFLIYKKNVTETILLK